MIPVIKDYENRPGKIDFLSNGPILEKIRNALKEKEKHEPSSNYYRGDWKDETSVLQHLFDLYHYKCAYCEAELECCQSALQVEHYRPKRSYRPKQEEAFDGKRHHEGYYWLTYEWSNLLLACSTCNGGKGAQFPVEGQRVAGPEVPDDFTEPANLKAFRADEQMYRDERPLLLNPERDNLKGHFGFTAQGEMITHTRRAETTVALCKLNRKLLCSVRKKVLNDLLYQLKKAAALVLKRQESCRSRERFRDDVEWAFRGLFEMMDTWSRSDIEFYAWRSWIKHNLMDVVGSSQSEMTTRLIEHACQRHQGGWRP